jgi:hypothetical protein
MQGCLESRGRVSGSWHLTVVLNPLQCHRNKLLHNEGGRFNIATILWSMNIDGVSISNRIYCTLKHTTRDYSAIANSHTLQIHHTLSRNGFQRRTFPLLWVPELSPCLSYQLLIATAYKDWISAVLSLTHSPTNSIHSTDCHCQHLGTDRTANTVPLLRSFQLG